MNAYMTHRGAQEAPRRFRMLGLESFEGSLDIVQYVIVSPLLRPHGFRNRVSAEML